MQPPDMTGVERRPGADGSLMHAARGDARPGTLVAQAVGGGITVGPKNGRVVLFGRQADDVHICIGPDDLGVSRRQGVIACSGGQWSVRNLGRRPLRLPSGPLHTNAEPVPLAPGYTPLYVEGAADREHLLEIYVVGPDGDRPRARPDDETHHPRPWRLSPEEMLACVVVGQRYLRFEPGAQPLSRRAAEQQLVEIDPDGGWTYRKVEHRLTDVRTRLSAHGARGLLASEVSPPVGNQLNENLVRELMRTGTIVPTDLDRLDTWADGD